MILLLLCPKCKHRMKYQAKTMILAGKRKVCVYCGKSFKIKDYVVKKVER